MEPKIVFRSIRVIEEASHLLIQLNIKDVVISSMKSGWAPQYQRNKLGLRKHTKCKKVYIFNSVPLD